MAGSISAALELPFDEAIAYLRDKADVSTDHWTDVWRQAHARSFMVAGAAGDALVGDLHKAVRRGLEEGTTLSTFRADFDAIVAKHGWTGWTGEGSAKGRARRTRIIYETNLSMAYAAGRYAQMTEPETLAAFPFWQYVHSGSANPRHQHLAWNGLTLRADDPFWQTHYPPNGWGCGCRVRPVSARGLARMGKRGPDTAPPKETREWVNPKTGVKHQVPKGIDPGFDYNPGEAWKGSPQIPGGATTAAPAGGGPTAPAAPSPATPSPAVPAVPTAPTLPAPKSEAKPPKAIPIPKAPAKPKASKPKAAKPEAPKPEAPKPEPLPKPEAAPKPKAVPKLKAAPPPAEGLDLEILGAILTRDYRAWGDALLPVERDALKVYKGSGYQAMNRHLRGLDELPRWADQIKTLDAALARAKAPSDFTVYRGVASTDPIFTAKVGSVVSDPGFLSTSIDRKVATNFRGTVLEIRVAQGHTGVAYVHPFPFEHHAEREVLFRPGTRLRVAERIGQRVVLEAIDEPRRRPRLAPRTPRRSP